jgi:hypothetical protein
MATDPQSLLASVSAHASYASSTYMLHLMKVALLRRWLLALSPGADTSPSALLEYAKCHLCLSATMGYNSYQLQLMVLVLTDQALSGSGGGGQDQGRITEEEVARNTEEDVRRYTEEL